jgi:uncharacterized protein YecT (DUF1311 family)
MNCEAQKLTNSIDQFLHSCLTALDGQTIDGMVGCINIAYEKWEDEMNRYITLLQAKLSDNQKAALRLSQENWLKFKEAEFKFLDMLYSTKKGSSYRPIIAEEKMNVIKARALELKDYYEIMSQE